jgi:predicted unusual protein kinase regulating ubiquinone biosynthesis (AarF/ABC1/UbiB family)
MEDDYKLLAALAFVGSSVNTSLPGHVQTLRSLLDREMQMSHERRMTAVLQQGLARLRTKHQFQTVRVMDDACTTDVFVYEHVDGVTFDQITDVTQINAISRRLIVIFFALMHEAGILLADLNPGNFVIDGDVITILDAGGVVELTPSQMAALRPLHASRGEPEAVKKAMEPLGELSPPLIDFMHNTMRFMWSPRPVNFAASPTLEHLMCDMRVLRAQANSEFTLVFRACAQLTRLLACKQAKVCVRPEMELIEAHGVSLAGEK